MKQPSGIAETRNPTDIYSVSQLNRKARHLLESALPSLWVAGEISNLAQPGSGHIYFSLKDSGAQIQCAMFRAANSRLSFQPKNGDRVLIQGPSTGTLETTIESLVVDDQPVEMASKGDDCTFPLSQKIRSSDKLYKLVEA